MTVSVISKRANKQTNRMKTKKCGCCKEVKPLKDFNRCKTYADGLNTICMPCARMRVKETKRRRDERKKGIIAPGNLKEKFLYHAIINESEFDKPSHLTYSEIYEIFENIIKAA